MTDARLDALFAHIAANERPFLDRLLDYVRHPSISAHDIGIREVAGIVAGYLDDLGMRGEIVETQGHPMVLGRRIEDPARATVLLYGHYDVQPPDPLEAWLSPPFEPVVRDGRVFARGVGDNKGQHLAQLLAIETHLAVHGSLPCNVIVLLEGEEEVGSPHIAEFAATHADRLDADLVVTADGPLHPSGAPVVTFGVRGMVSFDLVAREARTDTHSGNYGGLVPNPLWTLVHLLATMKTPAGEITIEGLCDPVLPPGEDERAAVARLPLDLAGFMSDLGISRLDAPQGRGFFERTMFHPTLTINGLHGGYGGPGSKAVLPCAAVAKCDIRLVEAMTPDQAFAAVAAHVRRHAPEVELVRRGGMLSSKTPLASRFAAPVAAAVRAGQGAEPLLFPVVGGSLPDYVFTRILGLPAFGTPYANADEANHAPNENLKVDCFFRGIRTGAALIELLGRL